MMEAPIAKTKCSRGRGLAGTWPTYGGQQRGLSAHLAVFSSEVGCRSFIRFGRFPHALREFSLIAIETTFNCN